MMHRRLVARHARRRASGGLDAEDRPAARGELGGGVAVAAADVDHVALDQRSG